MGQACFVLLALGGLVALAQTPPASKAPKAGEPVFADFGALTQAAPANNTAAKAGTDQGSVFRGQRAEVKGQGSVISDQKAAGAGQRTESEIGRASCRERV